MTVEGWLQTLGDRGKEQRLLGLWVLGGFSSFLVAAVSAYVLIPSDPVLVAQYAEEVSPLSYLAPAIGFTTALILNLLTLLVERRNSKMQMCMIVCYINSLAALTDYLSWMGFSPLIRDPFGQGVIITRMLVWLWTTPAMCYLVGLISDFNHNEVVGVVVADFGMLLAAYIALVQGNWFVGVVFIVISTLLWFYVMYALWQMFQTPIDSSSRTANAVSLQVVRGLTMVTWTGFVIVFVLAKFRLISLFTEEWLWSVFAFLAKVVFSSSLMQSNFITMEERRLAAMKQVEEGRRDQVIQELASLLQQKEQFMGHMSGELRTPLQCIVGLSDAMLLGCCGDITEVIHRTVESIKASGMRLLKLVEDILEAASLQQGQLVLRQERVRLNRVVDDVIDLLQPMAQKGVRLLNEMSSFLPPAVGDPKRIMQVFHQLISNACKYTKSGTIIVSAILKIDEIEVAVADTGCGIPKDQLGNIFMPFTQVEREDVAHTGAGIGLSLVKQLVEAHGGMVLVRSRVGKGTTVYVTFKLWDAHIDDEGNTKVFTPTDLDATRQRVLRMLEVLNLFSKKKSPADVILQGHHSHKSSKAGAPLTTAAAAGDLQPADPTAALIASGMAIIPEPPQTPVRISDKQTVLALPGPAQGEMERVPGTPVDVAAGGGAGTPHVNVNVPDRGRGSNNDGGDDDGEDHFLQIETTTVDVQEAMSNDEHQQQVVEHTMQEHDNKANLLNSNDDLKAADSDSSGPKATPQRISPGVHGSRLRSTPGPEVTIPGASEAEEGSLIRPDDLLGQDGTRASVKDVVYVLSMVDNYMAMETWLMHKGFKVIKALDASEALDLIQDLGPPLPDIILSDTGAGYEVSRALHVQDPSMSIPVIMVSAKGSIMDVQAGPSQGLLDTEVPSDGFGGLPPKPLGRNELKARIQAHLRYKAKVNQATRTVSQGSEMMIVNDLVDLLCAPSKAFSLPPSIKSKIENNAGVATTLQVFDDLTMVVIGITNLDALTASRSVSLIELLGGLSSLYIYLEDLLLQHNAYLVDCMEDKIVIVTGLGGDHLFIQACSALDLVLEVHKLTSSLTSTGNKGTRLSLSAGIHCCTAMASIVGVRHPVLQATGALADRAMQLQAICPPDCIHVSKRVHDLCARPGQFSLAVKTTTTGSDATYLHHSGPWTAHLPSMVERFERYMATHPFGPINSSALRLRPVQRALLALVQTDARQLVELLGRRTQQSSSTHASSLAPLKRQNATVMSVTGMSRGQRTSQSSVTDVASVYAEHINSPEAVNMLVAKLQLDKDTLVQELDHKQSEVERLQVVIDTQQLDLYGLETLQTQVHQSKAELTKAKAQISALQTQLLLALRVVEERTASQPQGSPSVVEGAGANPPALPLPTPLPMQAEGLLLIGSDHTAAGQTSLSLGGNGSAVDSTSMPTMVPGYAGSGVPPTATAPTGPVPDIMKVLDKVHLSHLAAVFANERITADLVPYMSDLMLQQLGVTYIGDIIRLRRAAQGVL